MGPRSRKVARTYEGGPIQVTDEEKNLSPKATFL